MSKVSGIRKDVYDWAKRAGEHAAMVKLMESGLSHSTARRLVKGLCKSEPSEVIKRAIFGAMIT